MYASSLNKFNLQARMVQNKKKDWHVNSVDIVQVKIYSKHHSYIRATNAGTIITSVRTTSY